MKPPRPLQGRRIIVTRGTDKADRLPALLETAGATVVPVPLIATDRLLGDGALRSALARLVADAAAGTRPWLVFSSEVAVGLVLDAVGRRAMAGISTAVVGPVTAAALGTRGVSADLVAPGQVAESLAAELVGRGVAGSSVLVIGAAGGRPVVAERLAAAGATVETLEAYRSVSPAGAAERLREELGGTLPDAITFTSGSTVRHCAAALGASSPPSVPALCIGPVTAAAARVHGWLTVVTAVEHTAEGVAGAALALLASAQPLP